MFAGVQRFIESPSTALVGSILLAAIGLIALNGRFTAVGYIALILAWAVVAVALRELAPPVLAGVLLIFAGLLTLVGYFLTPGAVPENTGTLTTETILSPNQAPTRALEIGDSGARINVGSVNFGQSKLVLEIIDGQLKVSTQIFDEHGDLIAELVRNEWKVAPPPKTFDRNYSPHALEVRNGQGKIVLQVKLLADRVQIQGEWRNENGYGVRVVKSSQNGHGLMIGFKDNPPADAPSITPIFLYPSERHFGQLRK